MLEDLFYMEDNYQENALCKLMDSYDEEVTTGNIQCQLLYWSLDTCNCSHYSISLYNCLILGHP